MNRPNMYFFIIWKCTKEETAPLKSKTNNLWGRARTTDTRGQNLNFFAAEIQIPLSNKYLGVEHKGLVFVEIMFE